MTSAALAGRASGSRLSSDEHQLVELGRSRQRLPMVRLGTSRDGGAGAAPSIGQLVDVRARDRRGARSA